jgi:hypothetical protein
VDEDCQVCAPRHSKAGARRARAITIRRVIAFVIGEPYGGRSDPPRNWSISRKDIFQKPQA